MTRRLGAATSVALLVLAAAVAAGPAAAASPPPRGNIEPAVEPVPAGEVAVVAAGAPVGRRVAVLVQNGRDVPVRRVRVKATATSPDGGRATRARAADVVPSVLAPGELALAGVQFRRRSDVPPGSELTFKVKSRRARSETGPGALDVGWFVLSPPLEGEVAQTLDLDLTNPGEAKVRAPILVRVVCFGEARRPALVTDEVVDLRRLAAGATATATVPLPELCPTYLVAAAGEPTGAGRRR